MKKKFAALFCAAVLAAGLPSLAFADTYDSPSGSATATSPSGDASAVVSGGSIGTDGKIVVNYSEEAAANVPAGYTPLATFNIHTEGDAVVDGDHPLTITFNVGASYAGKSVLVYIQHDNGSRDVQKAQVAADGSITMKVSELSVYSIVLDDASDASAAAAAKTDKSAKSPQTGADMGFAFGGAVVAIAGAGCAAYALRKKIAE